MSRVVRCGLIQAANEEPAESPLEKIKKAMVDKHVAMIDDAAKKGVQIICLQELFYGPYFPAEQNPHWYDLVERIPDGPTTQLMRGIARKHEMAMVVPIYEEEMTGVFSNTAAVIDADGTSLGKYRMTHIPHCLPGFGE
jgi:beta-ureidopropionase